VIPKLNKTKHLTFRISEVFASTIESYIQEQGYKNKSVMLRELFSEQINKTEVKAQLVEDAKR